MPNRKELLSWARHINPHEYPKHFSSHILIWLSGFTAHDDITKTWVHIFTMWSVVDLGAEMVEDDSLQFVCNVTLCPLEDALDSPKSMTSILLFFHKWFPRVKICFSPVQKWSYYKKNITRSNSMMCNYVTMKQNYDSFCTAEELKVTVELTTTRQVL